MTLGFSIVLFYYETPTTGPDVLKTAWKMDQKPDREATVIQQRVKRSNSPRIEQKSKV